MHDCCFVGALRASVRFNANEGPEAWSAEAVIPNILRHSTPANRCKYVHLLYQNLPVSYAVRECGVGLGLENFSDGDGCQGGEAI